MLGPTAMNMDIPTNDTTGENKQVMADDEHVWTHSEKHPMKQLGHPLFVYLILPFFAQMDKLKCKNLK